MTAAVREIPYEYVPTARQALAHQTIVDELLYGGAAGGGKLLSIDTPIPTPTGWSTMGDLHVGSTVFDEHGRPCTVQWVSELNTTGQSFEVVFDDGSIILADGDHEWLTFTNVERQAEARRTPEFRARRRASRPSSGTGKRPDLAARNSRQPTVSRPAPVGGVRTTAEIAATLRIGVRANHSVQLAGPLDLPDADLPIDPYVLGAWLGDGSHKSSTITGIDPDLFNHVRAAGYRVTGPLAGKNWTVWGLVTDIRKAGLFGNKHVPAVYLRASPAQRLALLQGLMDTDGCCNADGQVEFCNTRECLAEAVYELAAGLGLKPTMIKGTAMLYGVEIGPKWTVKWTAALPVFRLARKLAKLPTAVRGTQRWRYIVDCRPIPTVPMKCIGVDSASHLYLAGRAMIPTHNSRWARAEAVRACLLVPGIRVVLFRRTFPELERAVIEHLHLEMPRGVARYNTSQHTWRFKNGSILELAYLDSDLDVLRYQGAEYGLCIWEELTQFTEKQYRYLLGRLRVSGKVKARMEQLGWRPRMIATSNPGGPGHSWCKARFIDPGVQGRPWQPPDTDDDPDPGIRCYIPARVDDNPHIDAGYVRQLNRQEPTMRRALRDGDWDILEGVRFSQFRRSVHVIAPEQLPIPMVGYPRAVGVDYGQEDPFCALWGALLPGGLVVVYRELYKRGLTARQQAELMRSVEETDERLPGRPIPIALDPSTWTRASEQVAKPIDPSTPPVGSIAHFYREVFGTQVVKARNDRIAGWALLDEQMRVRDDEFAQPRLLIYDTCTELIRTLPALPRAKLNPEDADTHAEDHAADALRYLLMQLLRSGHDRTAPGLPAKPTAPITAELASARF